MKEIACGCVPWRRARNMEIEVLMILRTGGFWEFPKGKCEKGETHEETALRELKEETKLVGELAEEDPVVMKYSFTRDDIKVEKEVRLYLCRVPDGSSVTPEKREVSDYTWLPLEDIETRATYPEMKEVARKVHLMLAD